MTVDDLRAELEKTPFVPLRLHLASGKTVDVLRDRSAFLLRRAVMILQDSVRRGVDAGYNIVDIRNIEMLEQLIVGASKRERGSK